MLWWCWQLSRLILTASALVLAIASAADSVLFIWAGCWPGALMAPVLIMIMLGCIRWLWTRDIPRGLEEC
jgi:hypothetical protein